METGFFVSGRPAAFVDSSRSVGVSPERTGSTFLGSLTEAPHGPVGGRARALVAGIAVQVKLCPAAAVARHFDRARAHFVRANECITAEDGRQGTAAHSDPADPGRPQEDVKASGGMGAFTASPAYRVQRRRRGSRRLLLQHRKPSRRRARIPVRRIFLDRRHASVEVARTAAPTPCTACPPISTALPPPTALVMAADMKSTKPDRRSWRRLHMPLARAVGNMKPPSAACPRPGPIADRSRASQGLSSGQDARG